MTQAEALGNVFRTVMYPRYGPAGGGLLRLHSTYRHDLKIYSSDEGRVQTSAAAFTQGLLDLEGDSLTPILVRCVGLASISVASRCSSCLPLAPILVGFVGLVSCQCCCSSCLSLTLNLVKCGPGLVTSHPLLPALSLADLCVYHARQDVL